MYAYKLKKKDFFIRIKELLRLINSKYNSVTNIKTI